MAPPELLIVEKSVQQGGGRRKDGGVVGGGGGVGLVATNTPSLTCTIDDVYLLFSFLSFSSPPHPLPLPLIKKKK